jgi:8-oxo-dGTP pyrophosphatase MutT (NUDIX family)
MEEGESVVAAAVRETLEEAGITLDPAGLRHVLTFTLNGW